MTTHIMVLEIVDLVICRWTNKRGPFHGCSDGFRNDGGFNDTYCPSLSFSHDIDDGGVDPLLFEAANHIDDVDGQGGGGDVVQGGGGDSKRGPSRRR